MMTYSGGELYIYESAWGSVCWSKSMVVKERKGGWVRMGAGRWVYLAPALQADT